MVQKSGVHQLRLNSLSYDLPGFITIPTRWLALGISEASTVHLADLWFWLYCIKVFRCWTYLGQWFLPWQLGHPMFLFPKKSCKKGWVGEWYEWWFRNLQGPVNNGISTTQPQRVFSPDFERTINGSFLAYWPVSNARLVSSWKQSGCLY